MPHDCEGIVDVWLNH